MTAATTTLTITGMSCGNCVKHVTRALERIPGVTSVEVALPGRAVVAHGAETSDAALIAAIVDAGYQAQVTSS